MRSVILAVAIIVSTAASAQTLATAAISTVPVATVSPTFMGLAQEFGTSNTVMGKASTGVDAIYRQLETNLLAYGAPYLIQRIGGNSTNGTLGAQPIQEFVELNAFNGDKFSIGVNQACNALSSAQTQANSYVSGMPTGSLLSIEIGNEPDSYVAGNTSYTACTGNTLGWNPWTSTQLYSNLAAFMAGIRTSTGSASLSFSAPVFAVFNGQNTVTGFAASKSGIMSSLKPSGLAYYTQHYYSGTAGGLPTDYLLTSLAYQGPARLFADVRNAHSMGYVYRLDEMNSVANGGQTGVSDTHQSALWFLANAMAYAAEGVDGLNVEATFVGSASYNPAIITESGSGPVVFTLQQVNPIYYGMLAFQMATGGTNSQIYPVTVTAGTSSNIKAWATQNQAGTQRLVLVSTDETNSGNVIVANAASTASACYLSNSSSPSWTGGYTTETLAGQTFNGSTTGVITGTTSYTTLTPSAGVFTIPLAVAQAVIVKLGSSAGC